MWIPSRKGLGRGSPPLDCGVSSAVAGGDTRRAAELGSHTDVTQCARKRSGAAVPTGLGALDCFPMRVLEVVGPRLCHELVPDEGVTCVWLPLGPTSRAASPAARCQARPGQRPTYRSQLRARRSPPLKGHPGLLALNKPRKSKPRSCIPQHNFLLYLRPPILNLLRASPPPPLTPRTYPGAPSPARDRAGLVKDHSVNILGQTGRALSAATGEKSWAMWGRPAPGGNLAPELVRRSGRPATQFLSRPAERGSRGHPGRMAARRAGSTGPSGRGSEQLAPASSQAGPGT